jgi:hypothetical protein
LIYLLIRILPVRHFTWLGQPIKLIIDSGKTQLETSKMPLKPPELPVRGLFRECFPTLLYLNIIPGKERRIPLQAFTRLAVLRKIF